MLAGPLLAVFALVLVSPGPLWVRRWRFLHRVPRAALVLWQAGTVAALVASVGAGVTIGVALWEQGLEHPAWTVLLGLVLLFSANVVARLAWSVVVIARQTARRRRRHRDAVDLLARVEEGSGIRVLAEAMPIAYCLPGLRRSRVVLSEGTLATLAPAEVDAVLAHERAHLRARHDVVLDFFAALHHAFPLAVRSEVALQEGRLLVEMLADDAARRRAGRVPLARALVHLAGAPSPEAAIAASGPGLAARLDRLEEDLTATPRALAVATYLLAAGLVLVPVTALVLTLR